MIICYRGSTGEICNPSAQVEPTSGQTLFLSTLEQRNSPFSWAPTHTTSRCSSSNSPSHLQRRVRFSNKHCLNSLKKLKLSTSQMNNSGTIWRSTEMCRGCSSKTQLKIQMNSWRISLQGRNMVDPVIQNQQAHCSNKTMTLGSYV